MIEDRFLSILVCPETKQHLRVATADELARAKVAEGLTREDGQVLYPIQDQIPMLMAEYGIRIGTPVS